MSNIITPLTPIIQITGTEYLNCTRPIVYIWKNEKEYLYIGCCVNGASRLFDSSSHHKIKRGMVKDTDIIQMILFETVEDMRDAEAELIRKHTPRYNVTYLNTRKHKRLHVVLTE